MYIYHRVYLEKRIIDAWPARMGHVIPALRVNVVSVSSSLAKVAMVTLYTRERGEFGEPPCNRLVGCRGCCSEMEIRS